MSNLNPAQFGGDCLACKNGPDAGSHSDEQHQDWAEARHAEGTHDAWGRRLMQPYDGHDAWSCNNYKCVEHPREMYEQHPGRAPGWMLSVHDPDAEVARAVGKVFYDKGMTEDGRYLLDQNNEKK